MSRHTLYNRIFPRLMALLLVLTLLMPLAPAASAAELSGTCGQNLEWSFADGTLTITGKGAMTNYDSARAVPWHDLRSQIQRLDLPEGLTRIGSEAFRECENLTAVTLPSTVRSVERRAFYRCRNLTIVNLNQGLETIGKSAFKECVRLQDLRLPDSVTTLNRHAFYSCESLRYLTIPAGVKSMDEGVFAYCSGLIRADVLTPLEELPRWTFYGCTHLSSIYLNEAIKSIGRYSVHDCENLMVVYYGGSQDDADSLKEQLGDDNGNFGHYGAVEAEGADGGGTYIGADADEQGDVILEDTTTDQTEDSTITVTEKENISDPDAETQPTDISATIVEEEGWDQVQDAVEDALEGGGSVEVDVYVAADADVPDSLLEDLAGEKVVMTVIASDGTSYTLDFSRIDSVTEIDGLDLSYWLSPLEESYEALEGAMGYRLTFNKSAVVNAELMIQLPVENARRSITLYQIESGTPRQLQAVVADEKGVAHFYVASVDSKTEYLLGIDVPSVKQTDLLIPKTLEQEYGITEQVQNVDYVVTGRTSSWGIGFGQVTRILVGFMMSTAAIVGLIVYAWNKRKIRQGHLPGWDDEE